MRLLKVPLETYLQLRIKLSPLTSQHLAFKPVRQGTNWLEVPSEQRLSICNLNGPRLARLSCRENSATELRPLTLVEVEKHADGQIATKLITEKKSIEKPFKPKSQSLEKRKS